MAQLRSEGARGTAARGKQPNRLISNLIILFLFVALLFDIALVVPYLQDRYKPAQKDHADELL